MSDDEEEDSEELLGSGEEDEDHIGLPQNERGRRFMEFEQARISRSDV